ncbi:hypothetical protein GCM10011332_26440 [Terasakiella brassicae]|uniref:Uncharacterized protein n=1 Tax=Terasakiella brassicae TaxID=1634917 RepID=A0A917FCT3_9PROT|nr:hypothetical protein [Terasakiella brassicae]GGF71165.1 hypothetical protein GCM10011332_26440 [Terasakiella brassicae]
MSGRNLAEMARGLTPAHIPAGSITSDKLATNAVGADALDPSVTPVTTKRQVSGEYTITASAAIDWEHGLGSIPQKHGLKLKCVLAERGYLAGEIIDFPNQNIGVGGNNHNIAVSADATHVHAKIGVTTGVFGGGGPILIIRRDNGGSETLTSANWKLIIWAEA